MSEWLALALNRAATKARDIEAQDELIESAPIVTAVAEVMSFQPAYRGPYADAFATLEATNPTDDDHRWQQAKADARAFLDRWADEALLLGWSDLELFGLHPTHPLVRHDVMGLVWLLRGRSVVGIDAHHATLSTGGSFYRGHWPATVTRGEVAKTRF
ncbi:hypothetical protein GCM10007874_17740 [Labrys miyagiensis]|uniref:Uncharacterized protein n=1 Tax=Labrys miyagiensis TaxID=346912 RepID=A0ABQ6CGK1_9HYPH|nr:hypothetical protein [Labrys miyagiensis]GLS18757.1 hypothetical protein GCM10007874_17740 [Labrys miyagiensis]